MRAYAPLLVLALAAAACGPSVQSAAYVPLPDARADAGVMRIYEHTRPDCAFEEIGRLTGRRRLPTHSPDEVANAMRRRAREMGGDAIIAFGERTEPGGTLVIPVSEHAAVATETAASHFVGTVIRFADPSCATAAASTAG